MGNDNESKNPLKDVDENRDPSSGEPEEWAGRFDDEGELAKGGVAGTALATDEMTRNPFEEDADENEANDSTDGNGRTNRS